jgi:hypothetical protein
MIGRLPGVRCVGTALANAVSSHRTPRRSIMFRLEG